MTAPAVGIDLGTTYSCVAVYRNGRAEVIQNALGNRITPSVVSFGSERLIGEAAKEQEIRNAENTVFGVKRLIGRRYQDPGVAQDAATWPFRVVDDDDRPKIVVQHEGVERGFYPEEISAMVLDSMKSTAEAYLGVPVRNAVVTVPAYFNDGQRQATRDAAVIAGLHVLRIINEPTAGALAYGLDQEADADDERLVLIYDLGGGTFDVSVLCIEDGIFEVRATAGDTRLGGEDLDALLAQHLADEFDRRHGIDLTSDVKIMRRLRTASERAKRTLSSQSEANLELDGLHEGLDLYTTITRATFEELVGPLLRRTLEPVRKAMNDAKLEPSQLNAVVLVGGSTRIPMVQELLKEWFEGRELTQTVNPDEAVAIGAAVQASLLDGDAAHLVSDIVLLDVTPLTLGVATQGDVMVSLIDRNTTVPCERSKIFTTAVDNQAQVSIKVYEGERLLATENNELGKFILAGIPRARRGEPQIDVTFHINENGILEVRAEEQGSGRQGRITIQNDRGRLSRTEIERMIAEAAELREQDLERGENARARCRLEQLCLRFKERAGQLPRERRPPVLARCDDVLNWLTSTPAATAADCERKTRVLHELVDPLLAEA